MIQYLKKLDSNDIVCFIDGYDVICIRNLREMTDVFLQLKKRTNCKIVVAENNIITNNLFTAIFKKSIVFLKIAVIFIALFIYIIVKKYK